MLCPRPFSTDPGFRLSRVAIRVEVSRHSTFDHDDDVVVNPYPSERLNEPVKLVQYLFLSSSQSLASNAFDEAMRSTRRFLRRPSVLAFRTSDSGSPYRFPLPASVASICHLSLHFANFPYNHHVYKWRKCNV